VTPLLLPAVISALCLVGLYAAIFMQRKAVRFARGEMDEPSVVSQPRARIIGGVPNSAFGIAYYALLLVAAWLLHVPAVYYATLAAAAAAAGLSFYLAYSLLFVTRMPCRFCWTGHVVNWSLLVVLILARPLA
jgi:uncharacterized membrane protein